MLRDGSMMRRDEAPGLSRWAVGAIVLSLLLALAAGVLYERREIRDTLVRWTGEEQRLGQIRGVYHLALSRLRPSPDTQPNVPIAQTGMNPFGVNTFLEQEVEPDKRERSVQMIAEAGYRWIRQEFPWYDIEVGSKGNFQDNRQGPVHSAWDKYDNIVDLAQKYHVQLVVRLSSPPAWTRHDGDARGAFAPPDNISDYADYVAAVINRYRGRVKVYQIWNEPNIYPEWGKQAADPEAYTRLLCAAYQRAKEVDPQVVILSGTLAPTIELNSPGPGGSTLLNDFLYLQRMYNAGAGACFDVLAVQGYGLWSGPTDHRQQPLVLNVARNVFIRDLMVKNGDTAKPIWVTEMNWNAVPDAVPDRRFGQVTEDQQARYLPQAYQRAQAEWPWVGVMFTWFFKRPSDSEKDQSWYYFRLVEPDFTLLPVYTSIARYANSPPVMYGGYHQEDHWAVRYSDGWEAVADPAAVLGGLKASPATASTASFSFQGTALQLVVARRPDAGSIFVSVDHGPAKEIVLNGQAAAGLVVPVVSGLASGLHTVAISNVRGGAPTGPIYIDGFIVDSPRDWQDSWLPP